MEIGRITIYATCPRLHWNGPVLWVVCPLCGEPLDYYGHVKLEAN